MSHCYDGHLTNLTQLLNAWQEGEQMAEAALFTRLYSQLKILCLKRLGLESHKRIDLRPTEMLNELYMRLRSQIRAKNWKNRGQFFHVAARITRQIIVDEVRRKQTGKRRGNHQQYNDAYATTHRPVALDQLDTALIVLEKHSPEQAIVVDLHYFAGLSYQEIADVLDITIAQAKYRWSKAKVWLFDFLKRL